MTTTDNGNTGGGALTDTDQVAIIVSAAPEKPVEHTDPPAAHHSDFLWQNQDGTAAFYNYIYGTIAGFTEDESMLSNMVREGHLTRAEALERGHEYSKPRWESLREYAQLIGFSFE